MQSATPHELCSLQKRTVPYTFVLINGGRLQYSSENQIPSLDGIIAYNLYEKLLSSRMLTPTVGFDKWSPMTMTKTKVPLHPNTAYKNAHECLDDLIFFQLHPNNV